MPWHLLQAPDDNNLVVMGVSAEDMSIAANYLIEQGGGQVVVADGEILEFLPLQSEELSVMKNQRSLPHRRRRSIRQREC